MIRSIGRGVILTALLCGSSAWANYTKLDDFERTADTNMGPNWTEHDLDFSIAEVSGNKVAVAIDFAMMTYQGDFQGLSPTNDWFVVAALHNGEMTPQYVGLVLRYADAANSAFVKLQDNDGDGQFDYIMFLRGTTSGTTWSEPGGSSYAQPIATPTDQANLRVRVTDDPTNVGMLQVIVQLDANHNGIWGEAGDDEFVRGNLDPTGLGTGVGLAGTGGAQMDDFGGELVPEPATVALLLSGGLVLLRRRERSC
jgi:hypothetical protein